MKHCIHFLTLSALLLTGSAKGQTDPVEAHPYKIGYSLVEIDAYSFRRAYHDQESLNEAELEVFMNRNPEPMEASQDVIRHPLYDLLRANELLVEGNLNMRLIDSLPHPSTYQFSKAQHLQLETRLLEDPNEVSTPSYVLSFSDQEQIVLIDTLAFDWPPLVHFFTMDLNRDGKEELFTLFQWYIINGDNYDLLIYELKEN